MNLIAPVILVALVAWLLWVSFSERRRVKKIEAEIAEKSKNPLYRGTYWI
jgi:hypothetical protein